MDTTIHYLGGQRTYTLCGLSPKAVHIQKDLSSMFSKQVTCRNCLTQIEHLSELGFIPRR